MIELDVLRTNGDFTSSTHETVFETLEHIRRSVRQDVLVYISRSIQCAEHTKRFIKDQGVPNKSLRGEIVLARYSGGGMLASRFGCSCVSSTEDIINVCISPSLFSRYLATQGLYFIAKKML